MSLVYLTFHNENIFDVEKEHATYQRMVRDRYISKHKHYIKKQQNALGMVDLAQGHKLMTSSPKFKNRTMGYAQTPLNPPCHFLRKHQGVKWRRVKEHVCEKTPGPPPVPRRVVPSVPKPKPVVTPKKKEAEPHCPTNRWFRGHKHRTNFVAQNIEIIKGSLATKPVPRYVDTIRGERHDLLPAGLIPQYICGKDYGRVPRYLIDIKKNLADIRAVCSKKEEKLIKPCPEAGGMHGLKPLPNEDRQLILTGLKENYKELSKIYFGMSLHTDTISKKLRKSKLEADLRQLEQDMSILESNQVIYISSF